jgi:autotransporter-associated beta strand protein/YVTN family beta-propeller protein
VGRVRGELRSCRSWRAALRGSTALVGASLAFASAAQAQSGPFLYVPNQNGGTAVVVDTSTNLVAGSPIAVGNSPTAAAVTGDESSVYVTNYLDNSVSPINTATNTAGTPIAVGTKPLGVAITPDGKTAYVVDSNNSVTVISTATNTVVATIAVTTIPAASGPVFPVGVAVSPDGKTVYVTNTNGNTVTPIDTATNTAGTPFSAGGNVPTGVAVSPDGKTLYVTNNFSNTVGVINTANDTLVATITVAVPIGVVVSPDGKTVYVAEQNGTVTPISVATNTAGSAIAVGGNPIGVAVSPDGTTVYVTSESGTVTPISTATNTAGAPIAVGGILFPGGICSNGNALLASGLTFKANTSGALACTLASGPTGAAGPVFNGGTMQFAGAGIASALPISLQAAGGTFDTSGNNATLSGTIGGPGSLTKIGAGTLTLSGSSSYTGATLVNAGTLQGGAANAFSPFSAFTVASGATLDLNGFSQTIGSLSGAGTVTLGAGTLTTGGDGSSTTFSGGISGSGGLTKTGGGIFTLTGAGSYGGVTTISAGTLQIGNGGTTGSIVGNVVDNASLLFNRSDGIAFSGSISGTGTFTKIGAGTLTLSGSNAYTGATFVNAGTLQAGTSGNAFSPFSAFTVASGATLDLNGFNQTIASLAGAGAVTLGAATLTTGGGGTNTVFSGGISGTGGLTKIGSSTFVLASANGYTGGTAVDGGTLDVGNNGALGSGPVALAFGTTLSFLNSGNFTLANSISISGDPTFAAPSGTTQTISGVISDGSSPGTLEAAGPGTLLLSATETYTGATNVNSGALEVDGSIASSSRTTVNFGGMLIGIGTVGNTQINSGGALAPGQPGVPGTFMTIAGNLAFQSGATYAVFFNPSSATHANVTGTAALAGNVQAVFASGSYVTRQYDILHSAGLGGTTFGALTTNGLSSGFTASLSYTATDVFLNLTANLGGPTSPLPPTPLAANQQNGANALNNFFNSGGRLTPNFLPVFGLTGGSLANALSQLDGEAATDAERGAFDLMTQFLGLMLDPYLDGRSSATGAGGAPSRMASSFAGEEAHDLALPFNITPELKAPAARSFEQRWSAWGAAYGGSNRTNGDPVVGSTDVSARTYGFAGGMDYHFTPDTVAGFALGGGGTSWGLAQGLGGGRSDAFQAGIYGTTRLGPAYLAAALAFANHWMTTDRIAFAGDQLDARFNAQSYGARIETGYRYAVLPAAGVTPYAAVQAQAFNTPSYRETDPANGGFGLSYNTMTETDLRTELGARFDALTMPGGMPLLLRARAAWAHDTVSSPSLDAEFDLLPGASFIVNGAAPPKSSALASAGAELQITGNWSLAAKLDGEFSKSSQTYAGTGKLRYTW